MGFLDTNWVGDRVEQGVLGIDKHGRVVLADGFDPVEFQRVSGIEIGSTRTLTEGQARVWAWHHRVVFNKRTRKGGNQ